MEEREYNGVVYVRSAPNQPWRKRDAPPQGVVLPAPPQSPTAPYEVPKVIAEVREATADATVAEAKAAEITTDLARREETDARRVVRESYKTDTILRAIRNARRIATDEGGTGVGSLLAGLPATHARALRSELTPIISNLTFDRLQQMRDESVTGGAVGNVSNADLLLLGSTVANLDTGVDLQTFLRRLDEIERHFIGTQINALGIDPQSPEGRAAYKDEFGYTGVFDDEIDGGQGSLLDPSSSTAVDEFPPEYAAANLRYLRDNWGNLDPNAYVRFRVAQDEAFGFQPDLGGYAQYANTINEFAGKGGSPDQLGPLLMPERQVGAVEQGFNRAAQSAPGAFFANAGNAVTAGLIGAGSGRQEELNLLRAARPYSSMAGEIGGSMLASAALGGGSALAAGRFGGSLLTNPLAAEAVHGTVYGATQDENPLRGAGMGLAGTILGDYAGRRIGDALPGVFARDGVQAADNSVPTRDMIRDQAADMYGDMQARGIAAGPDQTQGLMERLNQTLASNGRIGGDGSVIIQDGPTRQAHDLIRSFDGQTMTPAQALTVRQTLGEGLTAPGKDDRRIANQLLSQFDTFADDVLPGHAAAREVASRGIRADQITNINERSLARGLRQKGNDQADAVRTAYGRLDERVIDGQAFFDSPTKDAIARVARGDMLTNALRSAGKFGLQNPLTAALTTGGVGGMAAAAGADPIMAGGIGATTALLGSAARNVAERRTLRAAQEAELSALGGPEYNALLEKARELAALRARGLFGGAGAAMSSQRTRQE